MADKVKGVNWHVLAIFFIAFGLFLVGLNRVPVPVVDGSIRADMARHIVQTGELWPVKYQGEVLIDHPPLFVWLTALSQKLFGINDFATNLVPRLCAFLTVVITGFIAIEAGYGAAIGLLAALILALTRDFVLSSVRGYIEPMLEMFFYASLWLALRQQRSKHPWAAGLTGALVWLGAFAKGPVALWPFVFFGLFFGRSGKTMGRRVGLVASYVGAFALCTFIWAAWSDAHGHWPIWKRYWHEQLLGSAVEGRGGAQSLEPLYFLKIMLKYYEPWLVFLIYSVLKLVREGFRLLHPEQNPNYQKAFYYPLIFALFGFGFVGGFSLVKWKFWYYIAPAYPAFALFIAVTVRDSIGKGIAWTPVAKTVFYLAVAWIVVASVYPVPLSHDRAPEVRAFKETIVNSPVPGPVWFVDALRDHNIVGTSGQWYFNRKVIEVKPEARAVWASRELHAPAWVMIGADKFAACGEAWCRHSRVIQSTAGVALVLVE